MYPPFLYEEKANPHSFQELKTNIVVMYLFFSVRVDFVHNLMLFTEVNWSCSTLAQYNLIFQYCLTNLVICSGRMSALAV